MWRWADVREDVREDMMKKVSRWEKMWEKIWRWADVKMSRCEDEKVRYRPPLLEEPCAQTLSGKMHFEIIQAANSGSSTTKIVIWAMEIWFWSEYKMYKAATNSSTVFCNVKIKNQKMARSNKYINYMIYIGYVHTYMHACMHACIHIRLYFYA